MTQSTRSWKEFREIDLLRESGHPTEALAAFERFQSACSDDETRASVLLGKSLCYRDLARFAEATAAAMAALQLLSSQSPSRPFAEFSLACAHQLEGDLDRAAEELRAFLQQYADLLRTDDCTALRREAQHRLAAILIALGLGAESLSWLDKLKAESVSPEEMAELQYREAKANTLLGRQDHALELFQQALAGPLDFQFVARAHFGVGEILFNRREFGRALPEFEEAVRLTEKDTSDHEAFMNWLHATHEALIKP